MKKAVQVVGVLMSMYGGLLLGWWLFLMIMTLIGRGALAFLMVLFGGNPAEAANDVDFQSVWLIGGTVLLVGGLWVALALPKVLIRRGLIPPDPPKEPLSAFDLAEQTSTNRQIPPTKKQSAESDW